MYRKKNVTLFKKSNGRTVGPSVMVYLTCAIIGLGVGKVRSNMDWSSSIVRLYIQPFAASDEVCNSIIIVITK